jgi:UDP-glucose 4-epimerase
MKILVTGGAGFIGSHLVETFLADGHEVAILDNFSTGKESNYPKDVPAFRVDVTDADQVLQVVENFRPDIIDHHSAQVSVAVSAREPLLDAQINILGIVNVLEAAKKVGCVQKIIYSSSGGTVYGEFGYIPSKEDFPKLPVSPYGLSKYVAEEYIGLYTRTTRLKSTILRYGNVYGPRQDPHGEAGVCAIFAKRMLADQECTIFGDGTLERDYVFVKDVAEANRLALTKGEGEVMNISSGKGTSVMEIFQALKKATHYTKNPIMGQPRDGDAASNFHSNAYAKKILGWEPKVSFEDGIAATVEFFRNQEA